MRPQENLYIMEYVEEVHTELMFARGSQAIIKHWLNAKQHVTCSRACELLLSKITTTHTKKGFCSQIQ